MLPIHVLHARYLECSGACTDTRAIPEGSLFFALKGPRFNANRFASEALAKGARYAVVDEPEAVADPRCLLVPDALAALQQLATFHRQRFTLPVIGITGSNGKTTTKELVQAVLAADRPTLSTQGNLNNHIGVPLTLLRLTDAHRIAIIEMGANKPGDIAELCAIASPTHGLITNIGKAHLEGFGGFDGVLRTKTELYASVQQSAGTLFVNADDPVLMLRSEELPRRTYGTAAESATRGRLLPGEDFLLRFAFIGADGREREVATRLVGAYNLPNALAAVAIGQHFGVPDDRIAEALADYAPSNNRSQLMDTGRNLLVLDAYNANPSSMQAALRNLAAAAAKRSKLAILGDMLELGAGALDEHRAIVALVQELGLAARYAGPLFAQCAPHELAAPDAVALLGALRAEDISGKLILIKGSRGIGLERVVPAL